jgi:hypothetical protein
MAGLRSLAKVLLPAVLSVCCAQGSPIPFVPGQPVAGDAGGATGDTGSDGTGAAGTSGSAGSGGEETIACKETCTLEHASASCVDGFCELDECDPGWGDCDGRTANGCETGLYSLDDCGACGEKCEADNASAVCNEGVCEWTQCQAGWGDCDGDPANGCEQDLSDPDYCGACDFSCSLPNAAATCASGSCEIETCETGWGDCNDYAGDGCETRLNTVQDCGGCGVACAVDNGTGSCASGSCAVETCDASHADCDGDPANGCEWDTSQGSCCTPGENADGDELTDCEEIDDGDPWTDPDIFNGVHVQHRNQCDASGSCGSYDTLGRVKSCQNGESLSEELDQYSGWDWDDPGDDITSAGYDFQPNWSNGDSSWQINAEGYINLAQDGHHCFAITGSNDEACASLYFLDTPAAGWSGWEGTDDSMPATVQHGGSACFDLVAGVYPIRWHYSMDNGSSSDFHLQYCHDPAADCTPDQALPSTMLRVEP